MANSTFIGFNFPSSATTSYTDSQVVREIQPVTTWDRNGGYTITRRWRGPIDSLVAFSNGGSGEADFHGTYFSGTSDAPTSTLGGAGKDGAISTNLERDAGGRLGTFTATWVTSNLAAAQWTGAPTAPATRGATSGDQFQESSLWTLDGNDLEKSVYECDIIKTCSEKLNVTPGNGNGFGARVKYAISLYQAGKDKNKVALADPFQKEFSIGDYFNGILSILAGQASITGGTNLQTDLESLCEDILRGQEVFTISQYVLRNVKTTQYTSSLIPHYANVNRIWTTANITTVIAAETRPIDPPSSTVAGTMPLLGVLGGTLTGSNWLYRTPDVQELNNGKWQITKEWWEGTEVSKNTYKAYGVA